MKMIKPIVNVSKIIDNFDAVVVGLYGVLTDGAGIKSEAQDALIRMKKAGKKIILLTNSSMRVAALASWLHENKVPVALFDSVISAGEILHHRLKVRNGEYAAVGTAYYKIGDAAATGIFSGLDYQPAEEMPKADFLYMGGVADAEDTIDTYRPLLEHAAGLGIPLVCAGNDTSSYCAGKVCVAPGAVAEQYAVLGGKIITVGKPDAKIIEYALADFEDVKKERILLIGDNMTTDIKGANLYGISSLLISKGVHVNFLGEGYIPDVAKTRELAVNFDTYPDFVISNLRW